MKSIFLLILTLIVLNGCYKEPTYTTEPFIQLKLVEKMYSHNMTCFIRMAVEFQDKEGDIGFNAEDSLEFYAVHNNKNFMIDYYGMNNGQLEYIPNFSQLLIKPVIPKNQSKPSKGRIEIDSALELFPSLVDSVKLKMYLYDRQLNKSNEIETSWIVF